MIVETNSYFKSLSRKQYIEKAHEIMERDGIDAISIRSLAREAKCSSTNLYRHFENLDELLFYAQMYYLQDYVDDLEAHEKFWNNAWESRFGVWECYARQAFLHPAAYQAIFFSDMSEHLPEALREYYGMFPDGIAILSPYLQDMLRDGDFFSRDFYLALRCVDEKQISLENAKKMCRMTVLCFGGLFKEVLDGRGKPVEEMVRELLDDIRDIARMYANDDAPL